MSQSVTNIRSNTSVTDRELHLCNSMIKAHFFQNYIFSPIQNPTVIILDTKIITYATGNSRH